MRKKILFISTNDGSDMRINKEIKTLHKKSDIIFLGVGDYSKCYVGPYCEKVILIQGKRNSLSVIVNHVMTFIKLLLIEKINSIHIINEQLYIFFYPFLFYKHTVLDLFDSIFLKKNRSGEKLKFFKKLLYLPANRILLTDENRYILMPKSVRHKCRILPNYPDFFPVLKKKEESTKLRILYNGWMGLNRGTEIIEGLLKTKLPLKVFMAGWFSDDYTKSLITKYQKEIEFLGVMPQKKALELAQEKADYILCVYAPINENNINASPNKVYDAIQTETPLIINNEVKVSKWIKEKNIGFIIPNYAVADFNELYEQLNKMKKKYNFSNESKKTYTWENVEKTLLKAHLIK